MIRHNTTRHDSIVVKRRDFRCLVIFLALNNLRSSQVQPKCKSSDAIENICLPFSQAVKEMSLWNMHYGNKKRNISPNEPYFLRYTQFDSFSPVNHKLAFAWISTIMFYSSAKIQFAKDHPIPAKIIYPSLKFPLLISSILSDLREIKGNFNNFNKNFKYSGFY